MKKILSLVLVLVFALAIAVPAFAANETSGSTALTYSVAANYVISIPEAITITNGVGSGKVEVVAQSLLLADQDLTFTITAATNYDGGFKLVNALDAAVLLDYAITAGEAPVAKDAAFLSASAAEAYAGKEVTLTYTTGTAEAAGTYSDTLTIAVAAA